MSLSQKPSRTGYSQEEEDEKPFGNKGKEMNLKPFAVYRELARVFSSQADYDVAAAWGPAWRGSEVIRRKLPSCPRLANQRAGGRC